MPYPCDVCDKVCKNKQALNMHRTSHIKKTATLKVEEGIIEPVAPTPPPVKVVKKAKPTKTIVITEKQEPKEPEDDFMLW